MKKVFVKPVMHFIPLAEGTKTKSLLSLSDTELQDVLLQCKEQEEKMAFQVSPDIIVRQIGDEWILVPTGDFAQEFNGMVSLNEFGYFIWQQFQQPRSVGQVLEAAHAEYADSRHMLDIQVREFILDYARMGLFRPVPVNNE